MLRIRQLLRPGLEAPALDLAAGACVALQGPSGAGKTLFLRAIADLDPNEGEVRLDQIERARMPAWAWRRRVMYVAATPAWWADRVADHMADVAAARSLAPALGLGPAALDWPVARLSTGEQQRLALIRALILQPRVLLLDEPTAALDAESTGQVEAVLKGRLAAGAAILIVSHDTAQAARLGARIVPVAGGRVGAAPC